MLGLSSTGRPALFLDRDGVINTDFGYVHTPECTEWIDGIFELCQRAQAMGLSIVVVTNQAGIARGYYSQAQFEQYSRWMVDQFRQREVDILAVYHCPHHPEFGIGTLKTECDCRKPRPGMILQAAREHGLDLSRSALLGDKVSDIQAAASARVGLRVLLGDDGLGQMGLPAHYRVENMAEVGAVLEAWCSNGER